MRPTTNTVQLMRANRDVWWALGLGPVSVSCAFDVPFGHFAFDHPRCGSSAPGGVESVEQSAQEGPPVLIGGLGVLRGEMRPAGRRIGG